MITVNELFSGIGSQRAALERLHIPHEIVGIAEIDKYAIQSYDAIYGKTRNYGDISKIDKLDYADFWTYSFPCTDISVAGKQEGIIKGKTRSGLLYEVQRLLEASWQANELPKYLMLENVKNLVGKKFKPQFDEWIGWLDELGYNSYYQVLNAKNYGIPQNRERVFAISIRKDIDNGGFEFPEPVELKTCLYDYLEDSVDEKYYLSEKTIAGYNRHKERNAESGNGFGWKPTKGETVASALLTSSSKSNANFIIDTNRCIQVGDLHHYGYDEMNRVYSKDGLSPTLRTMTDGDRQPRFLESEPFIAASRGRNPENPSDRTIGAYTEQRLEPNMNGTSNTITTVQKDNYVCEPKIIDDMYKNRDERVYKETAPTLRSERTGLKVVEPQLVGGIGNINFGKQYRQENRVYDGNKIAMCLLAQPVGNAGGYSYLYDVSEKNVEPINTMGDGTYRTLKSQYAKTSRANFERTSTFGATGVSNGLRIRKLTPKECWRLMGFTDDAFEKAEKVCSNSQLYKQAGNSIVVDVLYYIFKNLFDENYKRKSGFVQTSLF